MIRYIILVFWLDFLTTVIQSPANEENPVVRRIWERFGDFGLFYFDLIAMGTVIVIWIIVKNHTRLQVPIGIALFILCTFRLVVALQNAGVLPYFLTSWIY